jgi:hypothetical protein
MESRADENDLASPQIRGAGISFVADSEAERQRGVGPSDQIARCSVSEM